MEDGNFCESVEGELVVHELDVDVFGEVTRFAADYDVWCPDSFPHYGRVRFHSAVGPAFAEPGFLAVEVGGTRWPVDYPVVEVYTEEDFFAEDYRPPRRLGFSNYNALHLPPGRYYIGASNLISPPSHFGTTSVSGIATHPYSSGRKPLRSL